MSVASFRDVFLPFTLDSVMNGALHPERLRFGICWQSDETESLSPYLGDPRFRVIRYPYEESLGYAWARAEIQRLYRGEPYHLLIDSHSYMAKNWDVELIEELESKPCAKLGDGGRPVGYRRFGRDVVESNVSCARPNRRELFAAGAPAAAFVVHDESLNIITSFSAIKCVPESRRR